MLGDKAYLNKMRQLKIFLIWLLAAIMSPILGRGFLAYLHWNGIYPEEYVTHLLQGFPYESVVRVIYWVVVASIAIAILYANYRLRLADRAQDTIRGWVSNRSYKVQYSGRNRTSIPSEIKKQTSQGTRVRLTYHAGLLDILESENVSAVSDDGYAAITIIFIQPIRQDAICRITGTSHIPFRLITNTTSAAGIRFEGKEPEGVFEIEFS